MEKTPRTTALHLAQEYCQWPVLIWHGAADGKRGSLELNFLEVAGFTQHYALTVVHANTQWEQNISFFLYTNQL